MITAVFAMDRNGIIGNTETETGLPWGILPRDQWRYRRLTYGKAVIVGWKTYHKMQGASRDRHNVVLTTKPGTLVLSPSEKAGSIPDAFRAAVAYNEKVYNDETIIAGGGLVLEQTYAMWHRVCLTIIDGKFPGNVAAPEMFMYALRRIEMPDNEWAHRSVEYHAADERNPHRMTFLTLDKVR